MGEVNWQAVDDYLRDVRRLEFNWGTHDCVNLCAGILKEAAGYAPLTNLGLQWASREDACNILTRYGSLAQAVDSVTGFERINPLLSGRLDLVLIPASYFGVLSINLGGSLPVISRGAIVMLPLNRGAIAWKGRYE